MSSILQGFKPNKPETRRERPSCRFCGKDLTHHNGKWYCPDCNFRFIVKNGITGFPIWWDRKPETENGNGGMQIEKVDQKQPTPQPEKTMPSKKDKDEKEKGNWEVYLRQMNITPQQYSQMGESMKKKIQQAFSMWLQGEPVQV